MHTITVDFREAELFKKIHSFLEIANLNLPATAPRVPVNVVVSNLPLGDVIISGPPTGANNEPTPLDPTASVVAQKIIFERKTLQDLASSIRDGRYAEQSFRLNACEVPNHHVIYIVEGDLRYYRPYKSNVDKRALLSAMASISYYKGFSLYRSLNVEETAEFILQMAAKIARRPLDRAYYAAKSGNTNPNAMTDLPPCANPTCNGACLSTGYSAVHKGDVKKNNITPTNIGEIMLAQIPGVSTASAVSVMARYKTIPALLVAMQAYPTTVFKDLYVVNKAGKRRRLNESCIKNMFSFLHGRFDLPPAAAAEAHVSEEDSGRSDSEDERERLKESEEDDRLWRKYEEENAPSRVLGYVTITETTNDPNASVPIPPGYVEAKTLLQSLTETTKPTIAVAAVAAETTITTSLEPLTKKSKVVKKKQPKEKEAVAVAVAEAVAVAVATPVVTKKVRVTKKKEAPKEAVAEAVAETVAVAETEAVVKPLKKVREPKKAKIIATE